MCIGADYPITFAFEYPDRALARPATEPHSAGYIGSLTQEKVIIGDTGPFVPIQYNIVLPECRGRGALADILIPRQKCPQMCNLKIVGFLKTDKIGGILLEKSWKRFFAVRPAVGTVFSQAET